MILKFFIEFDIVKYPKS